MYVTIMIFLKNMKKNFSMEVTKILVLDSNLEGIYVL